MVPIVYPLLFYMYCLTHPFILTIILTHNIGTSTRKVVVVVVVAQTNASVAAVVVVVTLPALAYHAYMYI